MKREKSKAIGKTSCVCGSSDGRELYADGASFCYVCRKFFTSQEAAMKGAPPPKGVFAATPRSAIQIDELRQFPSLAIHSRKISKEVVQFFGVKLGYDEKGNVSDHYYPYGENSYKHRVVATKAFFWIGEAGSLFGIEKFSPGGKRLVITEGEIDAMSVAEASLQRWGKIYPVISITSATGAQKLLEHREFIRSFDEVVLWFDPDAAGKEALDKALKIVGVDKAKIAKEVADCKDANDVLCKHGIQSVNTAVWDAVNWVPAGIITKDALWEALVNYNNLPSVPYPPCMAGVNAKTKGARTGEIALFISGTGSGKSTLLREIMLHLLEIEEVPKDQKIGIVSLEEAPAETARKLSGMAIMRNPAEEEISIQDLGVGFQKVFGSDRVILLDHQGSISDSSIIDQLEYMALMGAKYLFIDHITIMVSEGADGLTGNEAIDKVMNDLLRVAKRHDVWIGLVSHLRKAPVGGKSFEEGHLPTLDDIKGSGAIKQISFDVIAFARNMMAASDIEKNTIKMAVLKSRYTGLTGSAPGAFYDHKTGRLMRAEDMPSEEFVVIN